MPIPNAGKPGAQSLVVNAGAVSAALAGTEGRHGFLVAYFSMDQPFKLILEISDDQGTTYYTVVEYDSVVVLGDAASATWVNAVKITDNMPTYWQLLCKNIGASNGTLKYDLALYDDLRKGG
jgi:hypothetical protein